MLLKRKSFGTFGLVLAAVATACDDPFQLQPAIVTNFVDTVTVFALQGTDINLPSGYDVAGRQLARTDRGEDFDFTFDIDGSEPKVFPQGALGLDESAGIVLSDKEFDEIDEAPTSGYATDSALVVGIDTIFVVRSRPFRGSGLGTGDDCPFFIGSLPRYGKFRVLALDMTARSITMEFLVNVNCGYRGLEPGLPRR